MKADALPAFLTLPVPLLVPLLLLIPQRSPVLCCNWCQVLGAASIPGASGIRCHSRFGNLWSCVSLRDTMDIRVLGVSPNAGKEEVKVTTTGGEKERLSLGYYHDSWSLWLEVPLHLLEPQVTVFTTAPLFPLPPQGTIHSSSDIQMYRSQKYPGWCVEDPILGHGYPIGSLKGKDKMNHAAMMLMSFPVFHFYCTHFFNLSSI